MIAPAAGRGKRREGTTILLVEDDEETRAALAELLEDGGYLVVGTANGRQAEDYLRDNAAPDAIVLDLWMPMMDGWTFAARLQASDRPPIPTVVITAAAPHWGYPVAAARVLRKPIRPARFMDVIGALVAQPDPPKGNC